MTLAAISKTRSTMNSTESSNSTAANITTTTTTITTIPPQTSTPDNNNDQLGIIAGTVAGGIFVLLIIGLVIFLTWRKRRRRNKKLPPELPPPDTWLSQSEPSITNNQQPDGETSTSDIKSRIHYDSETSKSSHKHPDSDESTGDPEDYLKPQIWVIRERVIHSPSPPPEEQARISYMHMGIPSHRISVTPPSPELIPRSLGTEHKLPPSPCRGFPGYINVPNERTQKSLYGEDDENQEEYENIYAISQAYGINNSPISDIKNEAVSHGAVSSSDLMEDNSKESWEESSVYGNISTPEDSKRDDKNDSQGECTDMTEDASEDGISPGPYVNVSQYGKSLPKEKHVHSKDLRQSPKEKHVHSKDLRRSPKEKHVHSKDLRRSPNEKHVHNKDLRQSPKEKRVHNKDLPQSSTSEQSHDKPTSPNKPKPPLTQPKPPLTQPKPPLTQPKPKTSQTAKNQTGDIKPKVSHSSQNDMSVTKSGEEKAQKNHKHTFTAAGSNILNIKTETKVLATKNMHQNTPSPKSPVPVTSPSQEPKKNQTPDEVTSGSSVAVSKSIQDSIDENIYENTQVKSPPKHKLSSQSVGDLRQNKATPGTDKATKLISAGRSDTKLTTTHMGNLHGSPRPEQTSHSPNIDIVELKSKLKKVT